MDRQREARELKKRAAAALARGEDVEVAENRRGEELARKRLKEPHCGAWGVIGETEAGEQFLKRRPCGREWCEERWCQESSHQKRFARWLPKALKIGSMGYHVFTFPIPERPREVRELSKFEWVITEILKRHGFDRTLGRYHWAGDKSVGVWNPHLNFLTESGHLAPGVLSSIKKEICEELGLSQVVYNYHYSPDRAWKIHKLKYVTRATFLVREWFPDMAVALHNFRHTIASGRWEDPGPQKTKKAEELRLARLAAGYFKDKWTLPRAERALSDCEKAKSGVSPDTGLEIKWRRMVEIEVEILKPGWAQIWVGLWQYKPPAKRVLEYRLFKDSWPKAVNERGP